MKLKSIVVLLAFVLLFTARAAAGDLTVAVAANVQYTFEELSAAFEHESGIHVKPVIGSSGKLTAQIDNGAPFDVFLSADMDYPAILEAKGQTLNKPRTYAYGLLVLWTMSDIDLSRGIGAVAGDNVRKIAIAAPNTAPYGRQAVKALKHYDLYQKVKDKFVYGESIAQASQFVTTKAAEVGFTAMSIVAAPSMAGKGQWIEIDRAAYEPIAQGVVILRHAKYNDPVAAQKFFDFIFSEKGQEIFLKYGYVLPQ